MDGTNLTWIGIDVAMATLDLHFLPSGQAHSLANSPTGHRQLCVRFGSKRQTSSVASV